MSSFNRFLFSTVVSVLIVFALTFGDDGLIRVATYYLWVSVVSTFLCLSMPDKSSFIEMYFYISYMLFNSGIVLGALVYHDHILLSVAYTFSIAVYCHLCNPNIEDFDA